MSAIRVLFVVGVLAGCDQRSEASREAMGVARFATIMTQRADKTGWFGKEVTVTGYYFGRTVSRRLPRDGGKIIDVRVDLITAGGQMSPKAGCHLPLVEPGAALDTVLEKNRPALTVRGTIKRVDHGGEPQLDPCTVISQ